MNQANINIRLAREEDSSAMLAIYAPYITDSTTSFELEVPSEKVFWQRVQKVLQQTPWLVCEWDGQLAGYAYAGAHRSREAYSWSTELSVYVHPGFRKRNIATVLYQAVVDIVRLQGYCNILAGITLPNPVSLAFHKNFGFSSIGVYRKVGYKFGAWRDTHWLQMFIGDSNATPQPITALGSLKNHSDLQAILDKAAALLHY